MKLGPFQLDAEIGRGSAGVVWRGVHVASGTPVAVKVLLGDGARRPSAVASFRREVRAVAGLDHPGIVRIYDYGAAEDGSPWLAMELAEGTLADAVPDGWSELRPVLRALLGALGHAHARGVVHRDVKPSNVLVGRGGLRLTDFGLASPDDERWLGGTPPYMAPEQFVRDGPDHGAWTDLYSLGCVAWHLATGSPPFAATDLTAIAWAQQTQPPPTLQPRQPVPEGFEAWLRRLLEKEPGQRFQRAADALWALDRLGQPGAGPVHRRVTSSRSQPTLTITDPGLIIEAPSATRAVPPASVESPPVPVTWRWDLPERPTPTLTDAGLGLWGLRAVPFVGREAERDDLWARLVEVYARRSPRLVVLQGAAGHGKSRLARWLAERAHELGAAEVLVARHSPLGGPADGLARLVARRYGVANVPAEQIPARLAQRGDLDDRDERDAIVSLTLGEPFETPEERWAVVERALLRASAWRPAVVWLDDAQWGADALRFAAWLLRRAPRAPILLVLTVQDEALAERPEAGALLDRALAMPGAERLRITPLDTTASNALLARLLPLETTLASTVAERTSGNPLFVVQLVGDWVQRGVLRAGPGGFALREPESAALPDDLHTVWARRLALVFEAVPEMRVPLEIAAALGQEVDRDEWRAASDRHGSAWSDAPADAWIERLADERLARRTETGFAFAHGMLRESLQRLAAEAGRARAQHAACAAALPSGAAHAERRGLHLLLAGDPRAALPELLAGVQARRKEGDSRAALAGIARWEEAARLAGVAPDDPQRFEAVKWKGISLHDFRRLDEAEACYGAALQLAVAAGDARRTVEIGIHLGGTDLMRGELDLASAHYEEALTAAQALGDELLAIDVMRELGTLSIRRGAFERAEALLARVLAFEEARQPHRIRHLGRAFGSLGELAMQRRDTASAGVYFQRLLEISEITRSRTTRRTASHGLAEVARLDGRYEEAEARLRELLALCQSLGREPIVENTSLAMVLAARGRYAEARQALEATRPALERDRARGFLCALAVASLPVDAHLGDWEAFDRNLGPAGDLLARTHHVDPDAASMAAEAAEVAAAAGHVDRAVAAWRISLAQWTALGHAARIADVTAHLARYGAR